MARVEFNVRTNREGTPPTYVLLVLESSRSGEDCIVTLTGDAGQKFLYRGTDQLEQQRVYKAEPKVALRGGLVRKRSASIVALREAILAEAKGRVAAVKALDLTE